MSYSCSIHGWNHLFNACPSCQQLYISTSNVPGVTLTKTVFDELSEEELKQLSDDHYSCKKKIERLKEENRSMSKTISIRFEQYFELQIKELDSLKAELACLRELLREAKEIISLISGSKARPMYIKARAFLSKLEGLGE